MQHRHTHLHESLKLEELAMQILKVLLEKVPEPVIKHDLDQHTESLLLWHLRKKTNTFRKSVLHANLLYILMIQISDEANVTNLTSLPT